MLRIKHLDQLRDPIRLIVTMIVSGPRPVVLRTTRDMAGDLWESEGILRFMRPAPGHSHGFRTGWRASYGWH